MKKQRLEKIESFNGCDFSKFDNINKYNTAVQNKDTASAMIFFWTLVNVIITLIGYAVAKYYFNVSDFNLYNIAYYYVCSYVSICSIVFTIAGIGFIFNFGFRRFVLLFSALFAVIYLIEEKLLAKPIMMPDLDKIAAYFISDEHLIIVVFFVLVLTPILFNIIKYFRNYIIASNLYAIAQEELEIAIAQAYKRAEAKEKERKYKAQEKAKKKARKAEEERKKAARDNHNNYSYTDDDINDFFGDAFEEFCRRCEAEEKRKQSQSTKTSNTFKDIFVVNGDMTFANCCDRESVKKTYRETAKKIHPDLTGSDSPEMKNLNVVRDTIIRRLDEYEKHGNYKF